jgi:non-heme chloroperoxidase
LVINNRSSESTAMPFIETRDKTRLYFKDWGAGRPVVLIHGWPLTSDSWDDHAFALANAGFRVLAYDRRGFGRSDQPGTGYDYNTLSDLATVLEATGAEDAAIVGFSMGGGEVARYLSRHGAKRVRQAALISSVVPYMLQTPDNPEGTPQSTFDEIADGLRKDRAQFFATFIKSFYGVGLIERPVSAEVVEWTRAMAMSAGLLPTLACGQAFSSTDFRPDLPSFTIPTLIVHGAGDNTVPIDAAGRPAARAIKSSTLIEYDGAPHGLTATHKDRLTQDLLRFLKG